MTDPNEQLPEEGEVVSVMARCGPFRECVNDVRLVRGEWTFCDGVKLKLYGWRVESWEKLR